VTRVLVGQFLLEANTFVSGTTDLDDFAVAGFHVGDELTRELLPQADELGSAWDTLVHAGIEVVPSVRAWVGAGPTLSLEAFERIAQEILSRVDPSIDGIFLSLHGAAVAEGVDDPEGELLGRIRAIAREVPIAVSLDCHAGITSAMIRHTDIVTGYQTVPHVDLARTGEQAARLLVQTIREEIKPTVKAAFLPMIGSAIRQHNALPVFGSLMNAVADTEHVPGVLAAAFFPSHPWRDLPDLSWSCVVTTDDDASLAEVQARRLARLVWDSRHEFASGNRPDIRTALHQALRGPHPFVIADAGDSPTGGSLGDSTELLRESLAHSDRSIWLTINDPQAVGSALATGLGATIDIDIGSGESGDHNARTRVRAQVLDYPGGDFTYEASLVAGKRGTLGRCAVLGIGAVRLVVHDRKVLLIDPSPYRAAGLDPAQAEVIQAKSHVSYKEGFRSIAKGDVVADTSGPTAALLPLMPYRRRPVPMFPFEPRTDYIEGSMPGILSAGQQDRGRER
jgi:microcystin degradation protein MlrC